MNIPIIILNWNGIEDTIECMDAVLQQTYRAFEIYLVDNGSETAEVEKLKSLYSTNHQIHLICNETNLGFAKGNNEVMTSILNEAEVPPYIVLLNNDTVVEPNWLEELIDLAKTQNASMVSSKLVNFYDRSLLDNAGHMMMNTGEVIPVGNNEPVEHHCEVKENIGACGGAALYATDMLEDIGLFDDFFKTGYEDAELGLRAYLLGYKTMYAPKAIVYHKVSQSIKKIFDYDFVLKSRVDVFYTFLKLMPWPIILLAIPSIILKYLIMIVVDIVFFRFQFLKLIFHSFKEILFTQRFIVKQRRKEFKANRKLISTAAILKTQTFFLWWDIKRFFKDVVFKKKPMLYK